MVWYLGNISHISQNPFYMKQLTICVLVSAAIIARAQSEDRSQESVDIIHHHDSIFWVSYNQCDVPVMASYFTNDLEFYHDKNGLTTGHKEFTASMKTGLCGKADWRLRRESVPGSVSIYPLGNYGAIISGEHVFYIIENGLPPRLDGQARFTHVWLNQPDNSWKMSRILSYDHRPATYRPSKP